MTALCECGAYKTIQPYGNAKTVKWVCGKCSPAKEAATPPPISHRLKSLIR